MVRKQQDSPEKSMSLSHFISLFIFQCIIFSSTIIGATKGEMNPFIASIIAILSFLGVLILALAAKKNDNENRRQLVSKFVKEEKNTVNNLNYRFSRGKDGYVTFDSKGYIVEAKGFGSLIWSSSANIDKDLVGKHVDELAEMLKKYASSREVYPNFKMQVHAKLLNKMSKN